MENQTSNNAIEKISGAAAILSLTEIGLGSLLHSIKLPFSGHFLSLNQALIIGKSQISLKNTSHEKFCVSQISMVSSLLKSLSPAGKKLTPMLAISAQGILFNLGTILFGINPLGIWVGCVLLSLWGFIQPIAIYMLLFGESIIYMAKYFSQKFSVFSQITPDDIWLFLIIIVSIKITLATFVCILIFTMEKNFYLNWQEKLIKKSQLKKKNYNNHFIDHTLTQNYKNAFRDLFNPLFIFTWILTGIFFYFAKSEISELIWIMCRPVIIGFILFLSIRMIPFNNLFKLLNKLGFNNFSKILQSSIDKLKKL